VDQDPVIFYLEGIFPGEGIFSSDDNERLMLGA